MTPSQSTPRGARIDAVAAHADVSTATVSRVLQSSSRAIERTRTQVLAAVEALDHHLSGAARSLAGGHHATYGLVLPELSGPYDADLLVGFDTRAAEFHQSVMPVLAGTKNNGLHEVRTSAARVDRSVVHDADADHVGRTSKPVVIVAGRLGAGTEAVADEHAPGCSSSATPRRPSTSTSARSRPPRSSFAARAGVPRSRSSRPRGIRDHHPTQKVRDQ